MKSKKILAFLEVLCFKLTYTTTSFAKALQHPPPPQLTTTNNICCIKTLYTLQLWHHHYVHEHSQISCTTRTTLLPFHPIPPSPPNFLPSPPALLHKAPHLQHCHMGTFPCLHYLFLTLLTPGHNILPLIFSLVQMCVMSFIGQ